MINATVISASCSVLKLAPHIEKSCGMSGQDFMQIVMRELAEMGVPGANKMFDAKQLNVAGGAQSFGIQQISGQGNTRA